MSIHRTRLEIPAKEMSSRRDTSLNSACRNSATVGCDSQADLDSSDHPDRVLLLTKSLQAVSYCPVTRLTSLREIIA